MEQFSSTRMTTDKWEKPQVSIMLFWDITLSQETTVKFLSNSQNVLCSAEVDDVLVGQVIGHILERWDKDESILFLYSIALSEIYQRKRIGTALIKAVRKLGQAEGC